MVRFNAQKKMAVKGNKGENSESSAFKLFKN